MSAEPIARHHRWTVGDFHRLAEAGVLTEDDRIELIEGALIEMAPIGSAHSSHVNRLNARLAAAAGDRVIVSVQNPVQLGDDSEAQPDIALLRWRDDFYRAAHPGPGDVLLIVEVADTSDRYDREIKVPLYARHGIPEVWLLDLRRRRLETYRQPDTGRYGLVEHHSAGQVAPAALPDLTLALDGFWS